MTSKVPGLISFILMIILYSCHSVIKQTPKKQDIDSLVYEDPEPKLLFGIPIDSSKVIERKIKRNQTLSAILQSWCKRCQNLCYTQASKNIYDLRNLSLAKNTLSFIKWMPPRPLNILFLNPT